MAVLLFLCLVSVSIANRQTTFGSDSSTLLQLPNPSLLQLREKQLAKVVQPDLAGRVEALESLTRRVEDAFTATGGSQFASAGTVEDLTRRIAAVEAAEDLTPRVEALEAASATSGEPGGQPRGRQFDSPTTPGPWVLIMQYGLEPYEATTEAVGVPSEAETGFAKLSDADINALPGGGDSSYNYYWLTSDGENLLVRTTQPYDETQHHFMGIPEYCFDTPSPPNLNVQEEMLTTFSSGATSPSSYADVNQCTNWYAQTAFATERFDSFEYLARSHRFRESWVCNWPRPGRCFQRYHLIELHSIRQNLKVYKFTAE